MGIDFKRPRHVRGFRFGEALVWDFTSRPLVEKTVSGSIASFSDGADDVPLKSCEITLPVSLTGYTEMKVTHAGKNIANMADYEKGGWISKPAGTSYDEMKTSSSDVVRSKYIFPIFREGIQISCSTDYKIYLLYFGSDGLYLGTYDSWTKSISLTNENDKYFVAIFFKREDNAKITDSDYENVHLQIEVGNSASSFEPFSGIVYDIPLPNPNPNIFDINGTYSSGQWKADGTIDTSGWGVRAYSIAVEENTEYKVSGQSLCMHNIIVFFDSNNNFLSSKKVTAISNVFTFTTPNNCAYVGISCERFIYVKADYVKKVITYGGTVDIVSGKGKNTHGSYTLPSTGWTYYQTSGKNTFNYIIPNCKNAPGLCGLLYPYENHQFISQQSNKTFMFFESGNNIRISICDNDYSSASDFGEYIAGTLLVHELATSTDFTVGSVPINSKLNNNAIYSPQGSNVNVTYYGYAD